MTQQLSRNDMIHLFAKQANAEQIDLSQVTEEQFEQGFNEFVEHILPDMIANGGEPVVEGAAPAAAEPTVADKVAAATEAIAWNAFLKQASDEQINLEGMNEAQLSELFGHFLLNVVPQNLENEKAAAAAAQVAAEKRASIEEVTVMGQHFADVAADGILSKLADAGVVKYTPKFAAAPAPAAAPAKVADADRIEAVAAQRAFAAQAAPAKVASLEDAIAARTAQLLGR